MWFFIAVFYALNTSLVMALTKKLTRTVYPLSIVFLNFLLTIPFMFGILFFMGGIPKVTPLFFIFIFCQSICDCVALTCEIWAIKHAPISLLSPLSSFTPVFATLLGWIFLHETPSLPKLFGITAIVCGAYLLNAAEIKKGYIQPFKKLFSNKGVNLYFLAILLFSVTPIFQKQAIFQTSPTTPMFAPFIDFIFITIFLTAFAARHIREELTLIKTNLKFFFLVGLLGAFGQLAAATAVSLTHIGYATAIFSFSSLFAVIIGVKFLGEEHLEERLIGASCMIVGAIVMLA